MATLLVFKGDALVTSVPIVTGALRIGRLDANDIVLPDDGKAVSRFHAELRVEGSEYVVYDLNSQNGTWVAASRINRAALAPGQDVVIGPYRLRLGEDETAPVAPVIPEGSEPPPPPAPRATASTSTSGTGGSTRSGTRRAGGATVAASPGGVAVNRQAVVYGGAGVAVLVLAALAVWLMRSPAPGDQQTQVSTTTSVAPDLPPADPDAEHVAAASTLVGGGNFAEAVSAHLEPVLARNPGHPEAGLLWTRAQIALAPPPPPVVATPQAPAVPKTLEAGVAPLSGESDAAYLNRYMQVRAQYESADQMLARSEWASALEVFERLAASYPGFRDVSAKAQQARSRQQDAAGAALAAGRKLEEAKDYPGAIREFMRARTLGANADADIARANAEARTMAGDLMKRARLIENYADRDPKRREEAVTLFRQVVALLPAGDPDRAYAEGRLLKLAP